jgi:ribosomal protein L37AE/L43A
MTRFSCTNCGTFIVKSAICDPYMCRDCERLLEGAEFEERYGYLDSIM